MSDIAVQDFHSFLNYTMAEILQEDIPLVQIFLGLIIVLFLVASLKYGLILEK